MRIEVRYSVPGTGIRRGMIGQVIYRQDGSYGGKHTSLAKIAWLVRFKGGAEIWMEPYECRMLNSG